MILKTELKRHSIYYGFNGKIGKYYNVNSSKYSGYFISITSLFAL